MKLYTISYLCRTLCMILSEQKEMFNFIVFMTNNNCELTKVLLINQNFFVNSVHINKWYLERVKISDQLYNCYNLSIGLLCIIHHLLTLDYYTLSNFSFAYNWYYQILDFTLIVLIAYRLRLPDVHRHVSQMGLPWAVIATKWFICLFVDVLPIEVMCITWFLS